MCEKLNRSLDFLRDKYGCAAGKIVSDSGIFALQLPDGDIVPLLPWRVERRFIELQKLIVDKTLEDVSTFRFASFSAGADPVETAVRELDLVTFMANSPVKQIFAVCSGKAACNVLARLENGMSASIECGSMLPAGAGELDRHEIIARRGVASDRAVDTQVPQSSIYEWTEHGLQTFTDVDTELFGLSNQEIWVVRAAFAVLMNQNLISVWQTSAENMKQYAEAIIKSDTGSAPVKL